MFGFCLTHRRLSVGASLAIAPERGMFARQGEKLARALSRTSAWRIVQCYAKPIGLEHVKPHDFRRFVGTELTRKRGIHQAQKALGTRELRRQRSTTGSTNFRVL